MLPRRRGADPLIRKRAEEIRLHGQRDRWSIEQIAAAIQAEFPMALPLKTYRLAHGWTRPQVAFALDDLYRRDGLIPPQIRPSEICRWEHGVNVPTAERQDYLTRLYQTRPDQLGFGHDYSPDADIGSAAVPPSRCASRVLRGICVDDVNRYTVRLGGRTFRCSIQTTAEGRLVPVWERELNDVWVGRDAWFKEALTALVCHFEVVRAESGEIGASTR